MRFPNQALGSWILIISLQPLFGQTTTARTQANTDTAKVKFDLAQASGFDFARTSNLTGPGSGIINLSQPAVVKSPQETESSSSNDLCYTMRVYNFTRQDGDAPRMTGSTTCTPANRANPRSIDGTPPKARYVPQ